MRHVVLLASVIAFGAACPEGDSVDGPIDEQPPPPDPFCFTRPALDFCADFDEAALPAPFTTQDIVGGTLTLDDSDVSSPAFALRATLDAAGAGVQAAQVSQAFDDERLRFKLFMKLRVDELPTSASGPDSGRAEVLAVFFPEHDYRTGLQVDAAGVWSAFEQRGADRITVPASQALPLGEWKSVRFDVEFKDVDTGNVKVHFGSARVVDSDTFTPPAELAKSGLAIGPRGDGMAGLSLRYDDITWISLTTHSSAADP